MRNKFKLLVMVFLSFVLAVPTYARETSRENENLYLSKLLGDTSMGNHPLAPYASSSIIVPRPSKSQYSPLPVTINLSFTDISGHWAESYIKRFAEEGFLLDDKSGRFRPDDPITYAEFVDIIARFQLKPVRFNGGFNIVDFLDLFSSLDPLEWYYEPLLIASETGLFGNNVEIGFDVGNSRYWKLDKPIISGTSFYQDAKSIYHQFEPKDYAQRQYLAIFLANLLEYNEDELNNDLTYSDLSAFDSSSECLTEKAVKRLVANDIITGFSDNTFRPDATITRAEMIVMLTKLLDKYHWNMDEIHNNLYANYYRYFWDESAKLLDMVNDDRQRKGVSKLRFDSDLAALAEIRVIDKTSNGLESGGGAHCSQTYNTNGIVEIVRKFGFKQHWFGENALGGSVSAQRAHQRWTDSTAHKENYMKSNFDYGGFAIGEMVSIEIFTSKN